MGEVMRALAVAMRREMCGAFAGGGLRSGRGRSACLMLAGALALAMPGHEAAAQTVILNGLDNTTLTPYTTQTITQQTVTNTVATYSTEIQGTLNGKPVYDQTFSAAYSDPTVQAALTGARTAITTAGGPAVVIAQPVLVSSTTALVSSASSTTSTVQSSTATILGTYQYIGPVTILAGNLGICTTTTVVQGTTRPSGCSGGGTTYQLPTGVWDFDVLVHTAEQVLQTTTVTDTTLLTQDYLIAGTTRPLGTGHTVTMTALFGSSSRLMRRLDDDGALGDGAAKPQALSFKDSGDGADAPPSLPGVKPWAEAYGVYTREASHGSTPGDTQSAGGLAAGMGFAVAPGLTVGAAIDQGWTHVSLPSVSESANVSLLQGGLYAAYDTGAFVARVSGVYGAGNASTSATDSILLTPSSASYGVTTSGVSAEVGHRMAYEGWRLMPVIGVDWQEAHVNGFTETGGYAALTSNGGTQDRTHSWFGLEAGRTLYEAGYRIDLQTYVRGLEVMTGADNRLEAAFVSAPTQQLTITGLAEPRWSVQFGAKVNAFNVTDNVSLYLAYDGRAAGGFESHAGTAGFKIRW